MVNAEERQVLDQVWPLVANYRKLTGKLRVQTMRNDIANKAVSLLVRLQEIREAGSFALRPAYVTKKGWGRKHIGKNEKWNGRCEFCKGNGVPGDDVAWDKLSGQPSRWHHVACAEERI